MKKCPYCAEKIKDEAIVCRYCGRDLNRAKTEQVEFTKQPKRSAWLLGAIWAGVFTIIAIVGIFLKPRGQDFLFEITIGPIINFIGWWLIITLIIWIWRKNNVWLRVLLFIF